MIDSSNRYEQLYETYIFLLKTVSIIRRLRHFELYQLGFKSGFTGIAHYIVKYGNGMTVSQLASIGSLAPHTVTEIINRMEKAGLVKKKKDSIDKRVVRIELTELGKNTYLGGTSHRKVINDVIGALTPEELKQFQSYLEHLSNKAREFEKKRETKPNKRPNKQTKLTSQVSK